MSLELANTQRECHSFQKMKRAKLNIDVAAGRVWLRYSNFFFFFVKRLCEVAGQKENYISFLGSIILPLKSFPILGKEYEWAM